MRRIKIQIFMSLDGVMQAPGGPGEDTDGGFALGGWSHPHWYEMMGEIMNVAMVKDYDLLLGRKSHDIFAAHWPRTGADDSVTR